MNNQELEQQLLSLNLAERIRILQLLAQSLTVPSASQPSQFPDELDLTRDELELRSAVGDGLRPPGSDRSPQQPLRRIPITIPPNFDESMPELWGTLEQ